ncbi:GL25478 [Drosophila persimilis]|uniref:GL25478 n=1 Tax=Drosophila persimilis TaxID=7234 RepID=B4HBG1_DROPE|nr:GL25478 [Drosophila persimilis]
MLGMIERWHRSMKASFMCQPDVPWIKLLPTVMLRLRTCFKESIKASAAEMLYGCMLRLPNEYFYEVDVASEPLDFASQFRRSYRWYSQLQLRITSSPNSSCLRIFTIVLMSLFGLML